MSEVANIKKQSVLYIEDNAANLKLVEKVFKSLPEIDLLTATEPKSGIELATMHMPELILLDINLPQMDGYEVISHLKTLPETKFIPVFAVTANAMPADIEKSAEFGFDDYLVKPLNILQFKEKILKVLLDA